MRINIIFNLFSVFLQSFRVKLEKAGYRNKLFSVTLGHNVLEDSQCRKNIYLIPFSERSLVE